MTRREQILAAAVALLVLVAGLFYGAKKITGVFISRSDRILELEQAINGKELLKHRGEVAQRVLTEYASRALPGDKDIASSRYRAWLHQWCKSAKIAQANVKYVSRQQVLMDQSLVYDKHTLSVNCQADLPQLVNLLYEFYSQDYLHRIKSLKATPLEKQKRLLVSFLIEAIAMPDVPDREMPDMPANRLAFESIDEYIKVIVGRNIYSPMNQPPSFSAARKQRGYLNRRMSFTLDVADPEQGQLSYRVEANGLEGLRIDPRTGKVEWTPSEIGDFQIEVIVTDDGMPAKTASQTIELAVTDPPPPPVREETPPQRTFDEAKYTFVTGIVEVNGRRQVWLTVRTEGKWLRLFEGDTFQVGSLDGKIVRIHPRHVEILAGQSLVAVRFGQSLDDGEVMSTEEEEVAATGS